MVSATSDSWGWQESAAARADLPAVIPGGGQVAIGLGIIGLGKHGARYLAHVADVPGLRVAALCRRDRAAGEAEARARGCGFHAEPEALLADPTVDAVVLVVPPTLNVRLA